MTNKNLQRFLDFQPQTPQELIGEVGLDKSVDFIGFDFSHLDLRGIDFSGFNLSDASFDFSILCGSDFIGTDLTRTSFNRANLRRCNFKGAIINQTLFKHVQTYRTKGISSGLITEGAPIGMSLGRVLFVEDEIDSIGTNIDELEDSLPGLKYDIAENYEEAYELLQTRAYAFSIIDGKIPGASTNDSRRMRGITLSTKISQNEFFEKNPKLNHVLLTHYEQPARSYLQDRSANCLAILGKGKDDYRLQAILTELLFHKQHNNS